MRKILTGILLFTIFSPSIAIADTLTIYSTYDGGIYNNSGDWSTARDATSGTLDQGCNAGESYGRLVGGDYYVGRTFLTFDTSAIPDSDIIDSAVLSVSPGTLSGGGTSRSINIYDSTHTDDPIAGDYDLAGTTAYSTAITQDLLVVDTYSDFTLNASGLSAINASGYSKFSVREVQKDVANSAPANDIYTILNLHYCTGVSKDPKLVITHHAEEEEGEGEGEGSTETYFYTDLGTSTQRFHDCVILAGTSSCMIMQQQGNIQYILLIMLTGLFYIFIAHLYYQIFPSRMKL